MKLAALRGVAVAAAQARGCLRSPSEDSAGKTPSHSGCRMRSRTAMCHSMYFAGAENLALEIATSATAIDERAWIDPEVVAHVGIDAALLESLKHPKPYEPGPTPVPQPPIDWSRPQLSFPKRMLEALMGMSDAEVAAKLSVPEPPVAVDGARERS